MPLGKALALKFEAATPSRPALPPKVFEMSSPRPEPAQAVQAAPGLMGLAAHLRRENGALREALAEAQRAAAAAVEKAGQSGEGVDIAHLLALARELGDIDIAYGGASDDDCDGPNDFGEGIQEFCMCTPRGQEFCMSTPRFDDVGVGATAQAKEAARLREELDASRRDAAQLRAELAARDEELASLRRLCGGSR